MKQNEMIQAAYKEIEKVARHFINTTPNMKRDWSVEDITQEVYVHFVEKGFFEKFDNNVTSFKYFVAVAAKNHIIDMVRKGFDNSYELDRKMAGKDGVENSTLKDFVEGSLTDQYSAILLQQVYDSCPDTQISPNYDLTWKKLLEYVIDGWKSDEIHKVVGISSGRISQLKAELIEMLKSHMECVRA